MSIRRQRQELANLRAMEEEEDRMQMHGSGGVPSMGVSQFRGGAKKSGRRRRRPQYYDEEMEGGFLGALAGLAARALPSIISGVSRVLPAASRVLPSVARPVSTAIVPFRGAVGSVASRIPGVSSIVPRVSGAVGRVLPRMPSVPAAVSRPISSLASKLPTTTLGRIGLAANVATPAMMAADYFRNRGAAESAAPSGSYDQFGDGGVLPGGRAAPAPMPVAPTRARRGEAAVEQVVGSGRRQDGRSARAAVVREVMREMGMSLPEASRYVKQNGLY